MHGLEYLGLKKERRVWGINISGIERQGGYGGLKYLGLKGKE